MNIDRNSLGALALLAALVLSACQSPKNRELRAERIIENQNMKVIPVAAEPFEITTVHRIGPRNAPVRIYIEGDGMAYLARDTVSLDPTPANPVSLRLAATDPSRDINIVYLARPCQYTKLLDEDEPCPLRYWTTARFSERVIASMNHAVDLVKQYHGSRHIELVGFSGGAAVALLIAARRDDVRSVRTVAGNLNHAALNAYHGVSPLDESLNPVDRADKLAEIPQTHFMGAEDRIVPPRHYESYARAFSDRSCLQKNVVPVSHTQGWEVRWPGLVAREPECR